MKNCARIAQLNIRVINYDVSANDPFVIFEFGVFKAVLWSIDYGPYLGSAFSWENFIL